LGLAWDVEAEPEVARVLSLGLPHAEATAIRPAFHMPADILELWKRSSSTVPSTFTRSLRVTEEDYRELLQTPRMDDVVDEKLPKAGKGTHPGYSPFWESELANLDGRMSTAVRLGSVVTSISDHLSRTLAAQGGHDHPLVQEAMLLSDLSMHLTRSAMSSRRRVTDLRRQQILRYLTPSLGTNFIKSVQSTENSSSAFLFGGHFCEKLRLRAERIDHETTVRKDVKTVGDASKSKGKGKAQQKGKKPAASKPSTAPAPRSSQPSRTASKPAPASSSRPSSGKRSASGPPKSHTSKKPRGGKGGRS
jgi:hypothetical protein